MDVCPVAAVIWGGAAELVCCCAYAESVSVYVLIMQVYAARENGQPEGTQY